MPAKKPPPAPPVETPAPRPRGRPKGSKNAEVKRTKGPCSLSLDLDVIAWLNSLMPEKSVVANRILREAMEKDRARPSRRK